MIKDSRRKTSLNKYVPLSLLQGFEKGYSRFACERELEIEQTAIFWPSLLWPSTLCLSRSLMLNRRPWGPLCWVLVFLTASHQHLLWTPTHQDPKPLRPGVAFPTTSRLPPTPTVCNSTGTQLSWLLSWLSYIIVQRPLDRPLDLWNRMFDRHQVEITVM